MAIAYVGVILWLLSPLVQPASVERAAPTPVRAVSAASSIGPMPLGRAAGVPERLPGAVAPATEGESEVSDEGGSEVVSSEPEFTEPAPEGSSAPEGGGGGSGGKTVIGFEG